MNKLQYYSLGMPNRMPGDFFEIKKGKKGRFAATTRKKLLLLL